METKSQIEQILKRRFFVTPTGYPPLNGFLDYGPVLAQIKQQIVVEYKKVFLDEDVFEIEPSIVLPYEVLKNSGHVDKFCDVIISDGQDIFRADHFIEDKIGSILTLPIDIRENFQELMKRVTEMKSEIVSAKKLSATTNTINNSVQNLSLNPETTQLTEDEVSKILSKFSCAPKHLADLNKDEIDFVVNLHNLYPPSGKPFEPARDFKLIFSLNERQFLRPELAQSMFTNFRKLFELNNERLPFASLCIGRSYRNEISARGGMLRTKEFEQAEIEYFTEDGNHSGFESVRSVRMLILPNTCLKPYSVTLGEAYDTKTISSQAVCYFLAKAQEFCLNIGIKLENLRYRQHNKNEMAHYADDCWDVEIKTLSGWIECAGIADRSNFDLTVHSRDVNTQVKRSIPPRVSYEVVPNKSDLGKRLKSKFKDFQEYLSNLDQDFIVRNTKGNFIDVEFEGQCYTCSVESRVIDCEFFIPRVIEPSFGISRVLYCLVEQSFMIRDDRNVLSLKPKMCYLHCVIGFLKYLDEFEEPLKTLKNDLKALSLRIKITERGCSIGRKYSSFDELGVPFFVTFDFLTPDDKQVTIRERDSMSQIRIPLDSVASILRELVDEKTTWSVLFAKHGISN
ncbi:glycine-tRNA ligase [Vittaforma corneae ATCC 50505]|uniref:glycine--tRNA ligase n=1 Tax=Vittaforma corneae (strain ATCC 50505) TaxID=993615 RepID=L2GN74_VITCO|nr:glycine-tRNA ligase [Vittaforma corneae ATCC 50505]ELA42064.1 glycine-tRNA ligase [Vittaforma corneae ATCC 50505]